MRALALPLFALAALLIWSGAPSNGERGARAFVPVVFFAVEAAPRFPDPPLAVAARAAVSRGTALRRMLELVAEEEWKEAAEVARGIDSGPCRALAEAVVAEAERREDDRRFTAWRTWLALMDTRVDARFDGTPLRAAIAHVASAGGIPVALDPSCPEALRERPVTLHASGLTVDAALDRILTQVATDGVSYDVREDGIVVAAWPVVRIYPVAPCDPARLADLVLARVPWRDDWELRLIGSNLVVLAPHRVHDAMPALLEPEIERALAQPDLLRTYDVRGLGDPSAAAHALAEECHGARIDVRGASLDVTATADVHGRVERLLAAWHRDGPPMRLATLDDVTGGLDGEINLVPTRYQPPEEDGAALFSSRGDRLSRTRLSVRLDPTPFKDALEPLQRMTGLALEARDDLRRLRGERHIRMDARWARLDHVLDVVAAQISEKGDVTWRYDGRVVRFKHRFTADFDVEIAGNGPFVTSLGTGPR